MATVDLSHTRTVQETLELYKVSEEEGLSNERVLEQRHKFGYNGELTVKVIMPYCQTVVHVDCG